MEKFLLACDKCSNRMEIEAENASAIQKNPPEGWEVLILEDLAGNYKPACSILCPDCLEEASKCSELASATYALVYGSKESEYSPGGYAVHQLLAKTKEEAIKEAKLYLQGDPKEWYWDEGRVFEDGLLFDAETIPENSYVVEILLKNPHKGWKHEAFAMREAFVEAKQKELDEEQKKQNEKKDRKEYERLRKKFEGS